MKKTLTILFVFAFLASCDSSLEEIDIPSEVEASEYGGHEYGEENEAEFSDTYGGDVEG